MQYIAKYPEKKFAKHISQRVKTIVKGNHKHHWSYNEQHFKDIIELSRKQHLKAHRFIKYDQSCFMYRRVDNDDVLDSKKKHYDYIMDCIDNRPD